MKTVAKVLGILALSEVVFFSSFIMLAAAGLPFLACGIVAGLAQIRTVVQCIE